MMMKRIVPAFTVPTTPFPANRGRHYYLPPWSCPLFFAEAAFGNNDETDCPGLYCPHPPLSLPTRAEITTCPPWICPLLFAEAAFGNDANITFPANRGRDYYLPADYVGSCLLLFVEAAFGNDDETDCPGLYCTPPSLANRRRDYYLPPSSCPFLFAEAAFGNDDETHCPGLLYCPPSLPSQPSWAEITTCPSLFAEAAFGNDDETNCSGLSTPCILSRHSGKADLVACETDCKNLTIPKQTLLCWPGNRF